MTYFNTYLLIYLIALTTIHQSYAGLLPYTKEHSAIIKVAKRSAIIKKASRPDSAKSTRRTHLTISQQQDDLRIFEGGLQEGHAGLYYFIDKAVFTKKCDSIQQTFSEGATIDSFYLKLRYLITLLRHGHTRINLYDGPGINHKMALLRPDRRYLPFQFIILGHKLYVTGDCSQERTIPKGAQIETINGVPASKLIDTMLHYVPADGINTTFKTYSLYNYYGFHFLYSLLYPAQTEFTIQLTKNTRPIRVQGQTPLAMVTTYQTRYGQAISHYPNPLSYQATLAPNTAYLKVSSFYKGFIERFSRHYEPFIDSVFYDLARRGTKNLILDIRNNEGGGDNYEHILFAHLTQKPFVIESFDQVAAKAFPLIRYTVNLSDDLKAYTANPAEFLRDDRTLMLKPKYTQMLGQGTGKPAKGAFTGRLYVLINGGCFSAANTFINSLYRYRQTTNQPIRFIGEENGGDIYANVLCAGQSYVVKLPASGITVDMPFLAKGTLNRTYPAKRLPDRTVTDTIEDVLKGNDAILQDAIRQSRDQ